MERVKYLPQDHVERICNELVGSGEEGFERELKGVIFSHVPEVDRLGQSDLDALVRMHTNEKQKRIDSLLKQLRDESRTRATLEARADPVARRELEEKIKRREIELEAHDLAKPAEVADPAQSSQSTTTTDEAVISELKAAQGERLTVAEAIDVATEALRSATKRSTTAVRLHEKLDNFKKECDVFIDSIEADASELGLQATELAKLMLDTPAVAVIEQDATDTIAARKEAISGPGGLTSRLAELDGTIAAASAKLDAPNQAYQAYLAHLTEWQAKRALSEGSDADPESLKGLRAALAGLEMLPAEIEAFRAKQVELAREIQEEKIAQVAVYRTLYAPVQAFIDSHALATENLKLEFRAELVNEDFGERLLNMLALNRRGSFMGIEEGRARARGLTEAVNWEDAESVGTFLDNVDAALHADLREGQGGQVLLKDQLLKGKRPEEMFNLLYGLEYIRPRYVLKWEGKDLSMLSPGERGTLLLVFYLLIDKSDIPLVIDQPEGNLDNHTVAKVLVECLKQTRKRRQVLIVTHNPNLAVVCDADQIVHAAMDKEHGNKITYTCGSLENPAMSEFVTDVLEGTRWAFGVRDGKYRVSEV